MEKILKFLDKSKIEFFQNFDLAQISSIRIGGNADLVVFPKTTKELEDIVLFFQASKVCFKVIGNASNLLFVEDIHFPLVVLSKMVEEIKKEGGLVTVSAGVMLSKFCDYLKQNKLSGFEGLCGIPATIGGAVLSNAGAFGYSISDRLVKVKVAKNGKIFELKKSEIKFAYHFSNLTGFVVLMASFLFENKNEYDIISLCNEFAYLRSKSQPNGFSLGSVYRKINGRSAGFYIERVGLKGTRVGGVVVSNKHANFFINDKASTASDFLRLASIVEMSVEKQFGVKLIPEIEKVGNKNEIIDRLSSSYKKW